MEEVKKDEIRENEPVTEEEAGKQLIRDSLNLEKAKLAFLKRKKLNSRLLVVGIIAVIAAILAIYFAGDGSNVRSVKVVDNRYVSGKYIEQLSGITLDSEYVLIVPKVVEMKLADSPLIESASVIRGANHSVVISVKEASIVGYRYDDKMELIMGDGSAITFDSSYISNLSMLPMFIKVPEEKTASIAGQLAKLDEDIFSRIVEVRDFALSYDSNMVKLVMEDGYRLYGSIDDLPLMDYYLGVIKNASDNPNMCLYIDRVNNVFQLRSCKELEDLYQQYLNPSAANDKQDTVTNGESEH